MFLWLPIFLRQFVLRPCQLSPKYLISFRIKWYLWYAIFTPATHISFRTTSDRPLRFYIVLPNMGIGLHCGLHGRCNSHLGQSGSRRVTCFGHALRARPQEQQRKICLQPSRRRCQFESQFECYLQHAKTDNRQRTTKIPENYGVLSVDVTKMAPLHEINLSGQINTLSLSN